ncbi:hypothetical protein BKA83DRAFT_4364678 [Pisolithus microcarpus]|nr:hypothetical protein BKA83DRAFT_4364678 [Pisolithus microcarpus]
MKDSPQDVYAKHLPYDYGYPLRGPEPMSGLPETYQDDGLQIGDVGIVDKNGQFDVLFNICKGSDNCLHDRRGVPENFQPTREGEVNHRDNAIPPGPIYSHGMTQILNPTEHCVDYQFHSSGRAGAILILPHGATSAELLSPEQFRKVAMKNALDWYEFAKKCYDDPHLDRSLYLITGFYKAPFWSLGSFNEHKDDTGTIEARRDDANPNVYLLKFSFYADWRCCRGDAGQSVNQTVFIVGFKITFNSWLPDPVVLSVKETETTWSKLVRLLKACFHRLYHFSGGYGQYAAMDVDHRPELSQPFHPSDIINRFLLSKVRRR